MKLIVGLGNPGLKYSGSRHNIGYSIIKALARKHKAVFRKETGVSSLSAKCRIQSREVVLALPLTYMNLSGEAVSRLADKYRIDLQEVLAVCDDLDLAFGRLRIRPSGSAGGHKGIRSIIESLKSENFSRLRAGIGRPSAAKKDIAEFVLSSFSREDKSRLKEIIAEAVSCVEMWVSEGVEECMNKFNKTKGNI
jgi:peptidyl-tRNA hydrolase, PTH1 family